MMQHEYTTVSKDNKCDGWLKDMMDDDDSNNPIMIDEEQDDEKVDKIDLISNSKMSTEVIYEENTNNENDLSISKNENEITNGTINTNFTENDNQEISFNHTNYNNNENISNKVTNTIMNNRVQIKFIPTRTVSMEVLPVMKWYPLWDASKLVNTVQDIIKLIGIDQARLENNKKAPKIMTNI